jgi:hypothetical protein
MESPKTRALKRSNALRAIMAALALLGGLSTTPAQADDHDQGRGDARPHERDRHDHHRPGRREYVYEHPHGYYIAPPPVYQYQPPPPPPALDFVFPLHLR